MSKNRIRYLISLKGSIAYIFSRYFPKIKIDSYDSLPIEKRFTPHNVTIHITSGINKDKNHYYYEIFIEKCSNQLAKQYSQVFAHIAIMGRFGNTEIANKKFYVAKRPIKVYDVNVDNIVISKLAKTKTNSKCLVE